MRSFLLFLILGFSTFSSAQMIPLSFWKKKSTSICPTGYVLVPKNASYVSNDFCVMQYEAKAETNGGGSYDTDGLSVALGSYKPASVSTNLPWRQINRDDAKSECESLGSKYGLISNSQWQTIARDLELQGANWTSGTVGTGCMFQGNNASALCGYNGSNPEASSATSSRGEFTLSTGDKIYDFSGNVWEWIRDDNSTVYGSDAYFSTVTTGTHTTTGTLDDGVSRSAKAQFGPSGAYSTSNNNSGLGYGFLNSNTGAILRGGYWSYSAEAGVFFVALDIAATLANTAGGFRCVFEPDPCDGTPVLGTICTGGSIYAGAFDGGKYMITPGNCNNSATPTCNGSSDSLNKFWRGSSGSYADIIGVENSFSPNNPSSSSNRGHVNTPVIVADASISSDSAADYCNDMTYGGYSDWYLPSKSELSYIYCHANVSGGSHNSSYPNEDVNCTSVGGKTSSLPGFSSAYYWSSTELQAGGGLSAMIQNFSDGEQTSASKNNNLRVRCLRRY